MVHDLDIAPSIDDNQIIWRYMDFPSFYSLLHTKQLFFRRIDKYSDEYEGTLPEELEKYIIHNFSHLFGITKAEEMAEKFITNLRELNRGTLSNSWIASSNEVYAMWKIYLRGSHEGIAIRTTVGKLRSVLSIIPTDFTLAKVIYQPPTWVETDYTTLAAWKTNPYSYEKELRILVYNQFEYRQSTDELSKIPLYDFGASFPINPEILIEKIYISPFAGSWFADVIKSSVQSLMPSFKVDRIITSRIKDR